MTESTDSRCTETGLGTSATADHLGRVALKLFARKGYASTSVHEIVEAAGVTKPMLYYYFGSKERLARRLVIEPAQRHIATLESVASSDLPHREREIAWLQAQLQFCRENQDRARFMFALYFGPLGAELAESVGQIGERAKAVLRQIVTQRPETRGWSPTRIDEYVRAVQGQMLSTVIEMLYDERSEALANEPVDALARRLIVDLDAGYFAQPANCPESGISTETPRTS